MDLWCQFLCYFHPVFFLILFPTKQRYPAGHVFIHRLLHFITSGGEDLWLAQHIYGALYIASLFLTCAIYRTAGGIPNWTVILLVLSKRLHSIYVLRLFNDCWAIFGLMLSIFAYSNRRFYVGSVLFRYNCWNHIRSALISSHHHYLLAPLYPSK